jgi:hypothetical protein
MNFNLSPITQTVTTMLTTVGLKILGAIAIWIIGRWLIAFALRLIGGPLTEQRIDPTLARYIQSATAVLLNIVLVVAILGFFGVETTSFAALLAAAGVAVGIRLLGLKNIRLWASTSSYFQANRFSSLGGLPQRGFWATPGWLTLYRKPAQLVKSGFFAN